MIRIKYIFLIIFALIISTDVAFTQEVETIVLQGDSPTESSSIVWECTILSEDGSEAVIAAILKSKDGDILVTTDQYGFVELRLEKGIYDIEISALGLSTKYIKLNANASGKSTIIMSLEDVLIDEVVIAGDAANLRITEITPGLQRMSTDQLESQSQFFGEVDVLRSIQSMSGVSNVGEGASGFNVRGGNADQNLILQDGHLIFNPSHALGFFSLFHPDLIQYVDLYKGGIPAKYGGRLSSVLSVETREGNKQKFRINGGIGLLSSRLTLEGPIIKDKFSFIVASRYSYADWIFSLVDNPVLEQSKAFFNDLTAKINGRIGKSTSVGMSVLRSEDDFQFGEEARFEYGTLSGEAYLKQLIGDNINIGLQANVGRYTSSLYDLKGNDQSKFTNKIDYARFKADMLYIITDKQKLNFGAEMNLLTISPGEVEPLENSFIIPDELDKEQSQELALYLESQSTIGENLDISLGVRYTSFANLGPDEIFVYPEGQIKTERNSTGTISFANGESVATYSGIEPRVSLRYGLSDAASFKIGYAKTYQYLAQISNTASATPVDIWQLSNQFVLPQSSNNFSFGFFKNLNENAFETSFEVFYRALDNVIDYKDFARLLLNRQIETELISGIGRSYGVEVNFNKKIGKLTWDANYTYSKSQRKIESTETQRGINRGTWYVSNYDIPHAFNMNMVKAFNQTNKLSFNLTYRTGRPTTAPVSSYTNQNVLNVPIYSDRNRYRTPSFHRLDVAYTFGPFVNESKNWEHSITLSIYNVYFRKNPYSVYFRQNPFESVTAIRVATLGTIFPSITFNFKVN